ncbi:MAG TPA: amino acid ABC transporter substrate-binding protein [Candidatus Limnocylindrales bacterium]|nr:amino acid ABC transporter substrate-binding protein [Candidatus Limnocylindrales bacterium]
MPSARLMIVSLAILALVLVACDATPPAAQTPGGEQPTPAGQETPGQQPGGETPGGGEPGAQTPDAQTPGAQPTPGGPTGARLGIIQSRGNLICGVNGGLQGFSFLDESTNSWSGFDADYCRAVAAAVLGDPDAVEFRALSADDRGPALQAGEIDVLIRNTTWTSSRDASWGNFGPTTFYDGQGMMVNRSLTDAASLEDLAGATICVQSGTTTELNLADQMRVRNVEYTPLVFDNIDATYEAYTQGRCDAVTSDRSQLVGRRSAFSDPGEHELLDVVMSKEPLGPVVPHGDDQWYDVVKWVVFATFEAEELGIDSGNVTDMASTSEDPVVRRLLGVQPEVGELASGLGLEDDWVVTMISAVGNYEEIYNRNLGPETPLNLDRGPNQQWTDGGLLYAPPYR